MKNFTKAALAGAILLTSGAFAMASSDTVSADKEAAIKTMLADQGYDVRAIKMEDGKFEAYVIKDGQKQEVYMDADLKIVGTKAAD